MRDDAERRARWSRQLPVGCHCGPSQALTGELGRASGSQGWTPSRMDGHSSAWLPCSLRYAPPASACLPTCLWRRLGCQYASRSTSDGAPRLVALTGWRRIAKVLRALLCLTSNGWNHLLPPPTHNREPYNTLLSDTIASDPPVQPMPLTHTFCSSLYALLERTNCTTYGRLTNTRRDGSGAMARYTFGG